MDNKQQNLARQSSFFPIKDSNGRDLTRLTFFPSIPTGRMLFDKIGYYDIETVDWKQARTVKQYDEFKPKLPALDREDANYDEILQQYEEELALWTDAHPLNATNAAQVGFIVPANAKGLKKALTVVSRHEAIEFEGVEFVAGIVGGIAGMKSDEVRFRWLAFRQCLASLTFAGFNNMRFDSSIIAKNEDIDAEVNESLTHMLSIKTDKLVLKEFDLMKWAICFGARRLKDLGTKKIIDIQKLDIEANSAAEYDAYNIRDCEMLLHFVHRLNSLGFTHHNMPSAVRAKYSEQYLKQGIEAVHSDPKWHKFRDYGARVEQYAGHVKDCIKLDFNSEYPSVQALFQFPKFERFNDNTVVSKLTTVPATKKFQAMIREKVDAIDIDKPLTGPDGVAAQYHRVFGNHFYKLKVRITRCADEAKHIFPFAFRTKENGLRWRFDPEQTYEVHGYEIAALKECDFDILYAVTCETEPLLFKDMVRKLYDERVILKNNRDPREHLNKIILNSGFGIWVCRGDLSKPERSRKIKDRYAALQEEAKLFGVKLQAMVYTDYRDGQDKIIVKRGDRYSSKSATEQRFIKNSVPPIGQFTLSHARAMTYFAMRLIERKGGQVYYTDTDSIHTDKIGFEICQAHGMVGKKMGQLKLEREITEIIAAGAKLYGETWLDDNRKTVGKVTAKGFKDIGSVNITARTSIDEPLKFIERSLIAKPKTINRKLVNNVWINEEGYASIEYAKLMVKLLDLNARIGGKADEEVVSSWLNFKTD